MTAVGITGRIRIVLEQQDIPPHAVFPQARLGLASEVVDDPLTRFVVDDELGDVIALGRRVLGVEPGVEVETRAVLEEDVRVAGAGDDLLEEVPRGGVGRHVTLAVRGAGETVLVLEAEDPALHLGCRRDLRYGLMRLSERHAVQRAISALLTGQHLGTSTRSDRAPIPGSFVCHLRGLSSLAGPNQSGTPRSTA